MRIAVISIPGLDEALLEAGCLTALSAVASHRARLAPAFPPLPSATFSAIRGGGLPVFREILQSGETDPPPKLIAPDSDTEEISVGWAPRFCGNVDAADPPELNQLEAADSFLRDEGSGLLWLELSSVASAWRRHGRKAARDRIRELEPALVRLSAGTVLVHGSAPIAPVRHQFAIPPGGRAEGSLLWMERSGQKEELLRLPGVERWLGGEAATLLDFRIEDSSGELFQLEPGWAHGPQRATSGHPADPEAASPMLFGWGLPEESAQRKWPTSVHASRLAPTLRKWLEFPFADLADRPLH